MNNVMADSSPSCSAELSHRVLRLQVFTIAWMTLEAAISLWSAWRSHSPALLAFGGDSLVELLSAAVVFWRFRFAFGEARAAQIAGALQQTGAIISLMTVLMVAMLVSTASAQSKPCGSINAPYLPGNGVPRPLPYRRAARAPRPRLRHSEVKATSLARPPHPQRRPICTEPNTAKSTRAEI